MKSFLLGSSALIALNLIASNLVAGAANAACTNQTPVAGQTTDCSGAGLTPVIAGPGINNVTVILENTSNMTVATDNTSGVSVNAGSIVSLRGNAKITTTGQFDHAIYSHGAQSVDFQGSSYIKSTGNNSIDVYLRGYGTTQTLTLNAGTQLRTEGANSAAIKSTGKSDLVINGYVHTLGQHSSGVSTNADSTITVNGGLIRTTGKYSTALSISDGNTVILNNNASIAGDDQQDIGIYAGGRNSSITLNNSRIRMDGLASTAVNLRSDHNTLTLNNGSLILTNGNASDGVELDSGNDRVSLHGFSGIQTNGAASDGVYIKNADNNTIDLHDTAYIKTYGATAHGVFVKNGNGNKISLDGASKIHTRGANADGIHVVGGSNTVTIGGDAEVVSVGAGSNAVSFQGDGNILNVFGTNPSTNTSAHAFSDNSGVSAVKIVGNDSKINLAGDGEIIGFGSGAALDITGNRSVITLDGTDGRSSIRTSGTDGVHITGASSTVALYGDSAISGGAGTLNNWAFYASGGDNTILVNDTSYIRAFGTGTTAVQLGGDNNVVQISNNGRINTDGSRGVVMTGIGNHLILTDHASMRSSTTNARTVTLGQSNQLVMGDNSAILATSYANTPIDKAYGVYLAGTDNIVALNGHARIETGGTHGYAIIAKANSQKISLNDSASILTHGDSATGINLQSGNNNVYLLGNSTIQTSGANTNGIYAHGNSNSVAVYGNSTITTTGAGSHAITLNGNANSVTVFGTLRSADAAILGDNNAANSETVNIAGSVISSGGTAIDLRDGDDELQLATGTHITGAVNGGAGNDILQLLGSGDSGNLFTGFETLNVTWTNGSFFNANQNADWGLSASSTFTTKIDVRHGQLRVNGTITTPTTTVQSDGVLGGKGTLVSNVTSTGTLSPGDNAIGTLTINGDLTQTGGAMKTEFGGGAADKLVVLGANGAKLMGAPTLNVIGHGGSTGGAQIILHADHGITNSFGTINFQGNGAATITQTPNDILMTAVDGTPVMSQSFASSEAGLDFLDSVGDEQIAGLGHCGLDDCATDHLKHLWAKGFGHFGSEDASHGNQAFDYTIAGTAFGGDLEVMKDLRVGVSAGYSNTDQNVTQHAASADIDTGQIGLYANWQHGPFFITGLLSGGWQSLDMSRSVDNGGGNDEADGSTHAWLFGSSIQAGAQFAFPHGWRLTPSAAISYQHQWMEGYDEHGGGLSDVSVKKSGSDAMRLKAQLELANDIPVGDLIVTPHLTIGAQQSLHLGGKVEGTFFNGDDFAVSLSNQTRTTGLIGLGTAVTFQNGLSTFVNYDGQLSTNNTVHAVTGGIRYSW